MPLVVFGAALPDESKIIEPIWEMTTIHIFHDLLVLGSHCSLSASPEEYQSFGLLGTVYFFFAVCFGRL